MKEFRRIVQKHIDMKNNCFYGDHLAIMHDAEQREIELYEQARTQNLYY